MIQSTKVRKNRKDRFVSQLLSFTKRYSELYTNYLTRAREAVEILNYINSIVPIDTGGDYDLIGDLSIRVEKRAAGRIVKRLRAAGFMFSDARYDYYNDYSDDGVDKVLVTREVAAVGAGCPSGAVGRLSIQWVAPYKGGGKCKIVIHQSTSKSLVCST